MIDLSKSIENLDLVFLDLETTGLDAVIGDSICEIGALKVNNRKVIDKFHRLINPRKSMPKEVYAIHKISDADLKDAPYFENVADELISFLKGTIIFAYNANFDVGFINQHLKRIDYPALDVPVVDILLMARDMLKLSRYNLKATADFFDIDCSGGLHRASEDALIAYKVFLFILDMLKEKNIEKVEDFISLYGVNSPIFKARENQKVCMLKEAIDNIKSVEIKHFSSKQLIQEKITPLRILQEGRFFYLLYQNASSNPLRIKVNRVLEISLPK